jgi:hypothetical protein
MTGIGFIYVQILCPVLIFVLEVNGITQATGLYLNFQLQKIFNIF